MTIPAAEAQKIHATLDRVEAILKASKVPRVAAVIAHLQKQEEERRAVFTRMVAEHDRRKAEHEAMLRQLAQQSKIGRKKA